MNYENLLLGLIITAVSGAVINKMSFKGSWYGILAIACSITVVIGYIIGVSEFDFDILIAGLIGTVIAYVIYVGILRAVGWIVLAPLGSLFGIFLILFEIID